MSGMFFSSCLLAGALLTLPATAAADNLLESGTANDTSKTAVACTSTAEQYRGSNHALATVNRTTTGLAVVDQLGCNKPAGELWTRPRSRSVV